MFLLVFLFGLSQVFAQEKTITGKVVDETGTSLPGATVSLKGTSKGVITDINGSYSITAPATGGVLVISYVGYLPKELEVGTSNVIDVTMAPDVKALDQVIVVGYGIQKKSLVTGSISKIDSKDITSTPVARLDQALQGKTSGVFIAQSSGSPGSAMSIKIRGNSSDGTNNPLYIVDGVKVSNIDFISPNDIESMEVLKDAASSAIYGAEGGNGVIIVNTKKGKKGESEVKYNYYHSWQNVGHYVQPMSAKEYLQYMHEAAKLEYPFSGKDSANNVKKYNKRNGALNLMDTTGVSTDWMKQIFQQAPMDEHNITFSSGDEKSTFLLSGSYLTQDGIIGGSKNNYTRYTFRFNGDRKVKEWLNVGSNVAYTSSKKKNLNETDEFGGIITSAQFFDPTVPVYYNDSTQYPNGLKDPVKLSSAVKNSDGKYYGVSDITRGEVYNPIAGIANTYNTTTIERVLADIHGEVTFFKGLTLTSKLALDYSSQIDNVFSPKFYYSDERMQVNDTNVTIENTYTKYYKYSFENYMTFDRTIGDFNLKAMGGISYENYSPSFLYAKNFLVPYGDPKFAYIHDANGLLPGYPPVVDGGPGDRTTYDNGELQNSYFGRLNIDYKEKIMLEGTIRRDGSSLFGPNNKYADFPSGSIGWNISKEDFFKDNISFINDMKIRYSVGKNGNKQVLANRPFGYTSTMAGSGILFYDDISGINHQGYVPISPGNAALKWETNKQSDLGLELGFLKNQVTFSMDYFSRKTEGQLAPSTAPQYLGYNTNPDINSGEVQNKGWEFDISYRQSENAFKYSITANASYIHNEVISWGAKNAFKDGPQIGTVGPVTRYEAGYPVWYFRGLKAIGVFQDTAEISNYKSNGKVIQPKAIPGDVKFADINGDGQISAADATMIGKPQPDWTFGLNLSCKYKGFDLGVFFQGVTGNQIFNAVVRTDRPEYNKPEYIFTDRWTPTNKENKYPRPTYTSTNNVDNFTWSSLDISNGDYLRLKNITLGYTLPSSLTGKIGIKQLRIYGTATNLLTLTKYKGTDPEIGMNESFGRVTVQNQNGTTGIDRGLYPQPKTYTVGVNVSF